MNTHADKTQENKSQAVSAETSQLQSGGESTFQFVDNRPEAITQRKLQEMANNSPRAMQLKAFQDIANNSPQAKQTTQLQSMMGNSSAQQQQPIQKKENNTGLPDNLKTGMENLSAMSLDDVKVHRNSDKPAQLQAHAFAQGADIHLGPGQEKHLPHEAWHVVQQKQGRVKPTLQMQGNVNVNDDAALEKEADVMGMKAISSDMSSSTNQLKSKTANTVVQRVEIGAEIIGLSHVVRKNGESLFEGEEVDEVTNQDAILIETSDKLRSRRGPNQELFNAADEGGEHVYRWFRVLQVNDDDYRGDQVYIRDETLNLSEDDKGGRETVIDDSQRDRVDFMEDALEYIPDTEALINIGRPAEAWDIAKSPETQGKQAAMANFQNIWNVCGAANENLMLRLNELGTQPVVVQQVSFIGAKDAKALAALLMLPVKKTSIIQVTTPLVHEFSIEKRHNGLSYLHQGYLSNFNAVWWSGLADSDVPVFTMVGPAAERMKDIRANFGGLSPIDVPALALNLQRFMATDHFGEPAQRAWADLPFPMESNLAAKEEQIQFIVTVFQFNNEDAAFKELAQYADMASLISLVMKEAATVLGKIKSTVDPPPAQRVNPFGGRGGLMAAIKARNQEL
jgi:hypothetical protein